jgi:D-alanyl-D-alanine carboxypeptidase
MPIHRIVSVAFALASTQIASVLTAQSSTVAGLQHVDSIVATEFARDSIASLTIGVVTARGLVWTKSYGFADMGTRRVADRGSVYRIGSITKMFTGLMLQQLVTDGKIRLSDPVERYYPEIREVQGYARLAAPITVLQFATMTSGLAREPKEEGPFWTGPVSQWDSTLHLALSHTSIEFTPGTRFQYSNIGYAILGATLGRAAGIPYVRWEKERILGPLDMRHTTFEIEPAIASDVTRGYGISDGGKVDGGQAVREGITGRGYKVPNGALFTTIDDLSHFLVLQMGFGPAEVVARSRLDSVYSGIAAATGGLMGGYGIGYSVERRGAYTWFGHNGAVAGYAAILLFDREHQIGVIVLRNALGGAVRPGKTAVDVLQYLVDTKLVVPKPGVR